MTYKYKELEKRTQKKDYYDKHKKERSEYAKKRYPQIREKQLKKYKEWYLKNRDYKIKKSLDRLKKSNYANQKTPARRKVLYIKNRTRILFPLYKCLKCKLCDSGATEHHHYTNPIEVDKFYYVCHGCHLVQNKIMREQLRNKT